MNDKTAETILKRIKELEAIIENDREIATQAMNIIFNNRIELHSLRKEYIELVDGVSQENSDDRTK